MTLALAPRLTIGRRSCGTGSFVDAPRARTYYHVNLPLNGHGMVSQNAVSREPRDTGVARLPTARLALTWIPDEEQYVIKLRTEQLEAHAAKLTGRPSEPIAFDRTFDLTSGAAQALLATAAFMHAELTRPGGLAMMPAACHELEAVLMTQLLMVISSQLTPFLHAQPTRCAGPGSRTSSISSTRTRRPISRPRSSPRG